MPQPVSVTDRSTRREAELQLHRDGAPGRREFEGVGEQLIEQLLHARGSETRRRDRRRSQRNSSRMSRRSARPWAAPHIIWTASTRSRSRSGRGLSCPMRARHVQIVHQPQQLVIALIQQGGLGVQLRIPLPLRGGGQLGGGQMQRSPESCGSGRRYWETQREILSGSSSMMGPPLRRCSFGSIYGQAVSNRGNACLKHQ